MYNNIIKQHPSGFPFFESLFEVIQFANENVSKMDPGKLASFLFIASDRTRENDGKGDWTSAGVNNLARNVLRCFDGARANEAASAMKSLAEIKVYSNIKIHRELDDGFAKLQAPQHRLLTSETFADIALALFDLTDNKIGVIKWIDRELPKHIPFMSMSQCRAVYSQLEFAKSKPTSSAKLMGRMAELVSSLDRSDVVKQLLFIAKMNYYEPTVMKKCRELIMNETCLFSQTDLLKASLCFIRLQNHDIDITTVTQSELFQQHDEMDEFDLSDTLKVLMHTPKPNMNLVSVTMNRLFYLNQESPLINSDPVIQLHLAAAICYFDYRGKRLPLNED